ncbi:MAG: 5-formyltetrahydrofolate cyclo-ligase, partial [Limnochordia bacterium]
MEKPKPVLRELLKKMRDQLDPELVKKWNHSLHQKLWRLPQYRNAEVVMLYLSFGSEVDTWPLLEQAWTDGKRTLAPKVRRYPKELLAVEITAKTDLE